MKFPRDWQGVKIKNLMLTLCDIVLSLLSSLILESLNEKKSQRKSIVASNCNLEFQIIELSELA